MRKKQIKITTHHLILFFIIILAVIFRFYRFSDWTSFGFNQEYQAFFAKNIFNIKNYPLTNINITDSGIYFGSIFNYFAALIFFLMRFNPVGWSITASILGIIVCIAIFFIGKNMFSTRVGILASLIYACSFLSSLYDRRFWSLMFIPIFSLLIGYSLYRILIGDGKKIIILSILFGLALQCHLSIIIFLPLIVSIIILKKKHISRKTLLLSLIIFIVVLSPVIWFRLTHNFLNPANTYNFFNGSTQNNLSVPNFTAKKNILLSGLGRFFWVPLFPDLMVESSQCKELLNLHKDSYPENIILVILGLFVFAWWYLGRNKHEENRGRRFKFTNSALIIINIFSLTLLFVILYDKQIYEYYFLYLFPWLAIVLGRSLDFIWHKEHGQVVVIPVICFFVLINMLTLFTSNSSYSYQDKRAAIDFTKKYISGRPYSLEALGQCGTLGGYRYLFEYQSLVPVYSYMDNYYSWIYQAKPFIAPPERIVLLSLIDSRLDQEQVAKLEEAKVEFLTKYDLISKGNFGMIKVYILRPKQLSITQKG